MAYYYYYLFDGVTRLFHINIPPIPSTRSGIFQICKDLGKDGYRQREDVQRKGHGAGLLV